MNYHDAYIHIQEASPLVDASKVLQILKQQPRIEFNQINEVFTYVVSLVVCVVEARVDSVARVDIHQYRRAPHLYTYKLDTTHWR